MKKIKVLKYPYKHFYGWSLEDIHDDKIYLIPPVFKREGWYYNRLTGECWYEYLDDNGKIRAYSLWNLYKTFEYELKIKNHIPLSEKESKAIHTIWKYANKKLKELYYTDKDWKTIRNTERSWRKLFLSTLKEIIND